MRLLVWDGQNEIRLTDNLEKDEIPPYAILSHTWSSHDDDEVTFADIQQNRGHTKSGYTKIKFCAEQAKNDKVEHFWVDTCCINKDNQNELAEAIVSMFQWYQNADVCYVFLSDVSALQGSTNVTEKPQTDGESELTWESNLRASRWFTRGWTLQELLAPAKVAFFSREGTLLGTKKTLARQIHEITTIPSAALDGTPLTQFSISERLRWTEQRKTKKTEDRAYCLLGIFNVFMPLIYGEGDNAFRRLEREINAQFEDDVTPKNRISQVVHLGACFASAPVMSSDYFVGRSTELGAIRELLDPGKTSVKQRRVVLGGMGGMGKTQIAMTYAQRYQQHYASVIWLNAASEPGLYANIRSAARGIVAAHELETLDNQQVLARFQEWLCHANNTQWLLIFDNHDDPDCLNLETFCPNIGHGSIIVTTRRPDKVAGRQINVQPVQAMDECLEILQLRSMRNETKNGACRLATRLGGLPLALATAGAYLHKSTITFQQYLDAYEKCWQVDHRRPISLLEYRDRTLHTTWNLTFSHLETFDIEAAHLLRLFAYFDNQEIWYELLQAGFSEQTLAWLPACLVDPIDFASAMSTLVNYCFVEIRYSSQSYSLHNCIHDWILGALNTTVNVQLYCYAFDCVAASIENADLDALVQVQYSRLSYHAVHLSHPRFKLFDQPEFLLSNRLGKALSIAILLRSQLQLPAAEQICMQALIKSEKSLGADHLFTLIVIHDLGDVCRIQGKSAEAEQMYDRALAGFEKALGPDHPFTLITVDNLAVLYHEQSKLLEAERMFLRALAGFERALEVDHPSTLSTLNKFANLYHEQGKLAQAEQMYDRALAGFKKAVGEDHLSTLTAVDSLANLYRKQGKLLEAERMFLRALAGKEKVVGEYHPSTLDTVHGLANLYREQGKLLRAEQMYIRALAGKEKTLGKDHSSTLSTVNSFGNLYLKQGKLAQAEQMYHRALAGEEKAVRAEHTLTLAAVNNLGLLYCAQGKPAEAEQLHLRALAGFEKALGPDHPSTLHTVRCLGNLYDEHDNLVRAEQYLKRAAIDKATGTRS